MPFSANVIYASRENIFGSFYKKAYRFKVLFAITYVAHPITAIFAASSSLRRWIVVFYFSPLIFLKFCLYVALFVQFQVCPQVALIRKRFTHARRVGTCRRMVFSDMRLKWGPCRKVSASLFRFWDAHWVDTGIAFAWSWFVRIPSWKRISTYCHESFGERGGAGLCWMTLSSLHGRSGMAWYQEEHEPNLYGFVTGGASQTPPRNLWLDTMKLT